MNQIYIHILAPVVAALLMNGLIFSQGWKIAKSKNPNPYIPPGGIVGLVWMILFGLLGYVHYRLYSENKNRSTTASIAIILFILYSLAYYPILVVFGSNPNAFSILNLGALLFAAVITALVYQENVALLPYMAPLMAWTGYVNLVT
jgi:tryptophan-rich sensory protein